jgi:hypothetical protein
MTLQVPNMEGMEDKKLFVVELYRYFYTQYQLNGLY